MRRTPESQELMTDEGQAQAYAESDFTEPHTKFVDQFRERFPGFSEGIAVDLGCGMLTQRYVLHVLFHKQGL